MSFDSLWFIQMMILDNLSAKEKTDPLPQLEKLIL